MTPQQLFDASLKQANWCLNHACVNGEMSCATPCTDWNLKELINHMVYELSWIPEILAGKTVQEVGGKYDGDLIGNEVIKVWESAVNKASDAVGSANTDENVHLSYADVPASDYISEVASDMLIHSWDVAQALGYSVIMDEPVAEQVYKKSLPRINEFMSSGLFGTPRELKQEARLQAKLLALFGRSEEWGKTYALVN